MLSSTILPISSLSQALQHFSTGDQVCIDLDIALSLTGLNLYAGETHLNESGLIDDIKVLHERKIKIIGFTARELQFAGLTVARLGFHNIQLDEIIYSTNTNLGSESHPPNKLEEVTNNQSLQKAVLLIKYVNEQREEIRAGKLKRIFIFGHSLTQLQAIQEMSASLEIPIFLRHYNYPQYLTPLNNAEYHLFPENLQDYTQATELTGGTRSVFSIVDPKTNQCYILKLGAHPDAAKLEVMANALYQVLSVRVPPMRVYTQISMQLAREIGLDSPYGFFKVCPFIQEAEDLSPAERLQIIKKAVMSKYMVHVLLGNIDVAKKDNFIVDKDHQVYCIDAGANFMFRAKGELRKEDPAWVSEIDSLTDLNINSDAHDWFHGVNKEAQQAQLAAIIAQHTSIEKLAWEFSQAIKLSDALRENFLKHLSERVDVLVRRLQVKLQCLTKIDKTPHPKVTAAGVLTYMLDDGQPKILLSKRVRHEWWDNFGGKSELSDETLADTAAREVAEESNQQINYTVLELLNAPFHDIVTGKEGNQSIYRMYISEYKDLNIATLTDREHTAHKWVPLEIILKAMHETEIIVEDKQTASLLLEGESLILYPPLYAMLKQTLVLSNLARLNDGLPLVNSKTLGFANIESLELNAYRPLITPRQMRNEIAMKMLKHSAVLSELHIKQDQIASTKRNKQKMLDELCCRNEVDLPLTQSEIHLKAILAKDYQEKNLIANIQHFLNKYHPKVSDERGELIKNCIQLIKNEKENPEQFFFYHGCNNEIAFVYDIYSQLYRKLQADHEWTAFRTDTHDKRFNHIIDFIAYFSNNSSHLICNNDKDFNESTLSANVFLFGNHQKMSSNSLYYMLNNDVKRSIDLAALLHNVFKSMNISDPVMTRLLSLFQRYMQTQGGALYQISMSLEEARLYSYASGSLGVVMPFEDSYDLPKIIERFKENESLIDRETDFISQLQARVMLPPKLKVTTHKVVLNPLPAAVQKVYQAELEKVIDEVVFQLLSHPNASNRNQPQTVLTRILPFASCANQLNDSIFSPITILLEAIDANDGIKLAEIVRKYPETLYQNHFKPLSYLSASKKNGRKAIKSITNQMYIIRNTTLPLEGIIDAKQEDWLNLFCDMNDCCELKSILARLAVNIRYQFALRCIAIKTTDDILEVLPLLPHHDRLGYVEYYMQKIKEGAVRVSMVNPYLISLANYLSVPERLPFMQSHLSTVSDLAYMMSLLPQAERLSVANQHLSYIKTSTQLQNILKYLTEEHYYVYACKILHKFKSIHDLAAIVKLMPINVRLKFAVSHENKIKRDEKNALANVLVHLLESERLEYANRNFDKFDAIEGIIGLLPSNERYTFAIQHQQYLTSVSLPKIIPLLNQEKRIDFVLANKRLYIEIGSNQAALFYDTLSAIPRENVMDFANIFSVNMEQWRLKALAKFIPSSALCEFMSAFINDGESLRSVLPLIPQAERLPVALQFKQHINPILIFHIATLFEEKDRLFFIHEYIKCFPDFEPDKSTYLDMIAIIPKADRLLFASNYQHLIQSTEDILMVMKRLSLEDAFTYAVENINRNGIKFPDLYFLGLIQYFPLEQRLALLQKLQIDLSYYSDELLKMVPGLELEMMKSAKDINFASLANGFFKGEQKQNKDVHEKDKVENQSPVGALLPSSSN